MNFKKSKCLIEINIDGIDYYLLGYVDDCDYQHTVLGGSKDKKDKYPMDTLTREFYEETSGVLSLDINLTDHNYTLKDCDELSIPLELKEIHIIEKRYYYIFICNDVELLLENLDNWNSIMKKNQAKIYNTLIDTILDMSNNTIPMELIDDLCNLYRYDRYTKRKEYKEILTNYLKPYVDNEEKLILIFKTIEDMFVYMEVYELVLLDKDTLLSSNDYFIYEKEIVPLL